jgi:PEGA domain
MNARSVLVAFSTILAIAIWSCEGLSRWQDADRFRRQLRCGMTEAQVDTLARSLGAPGIRGTRDSSLGDSAVQKGGTVFWFRFKDGGLQTVRQGQHYGVTGLDTSVIQNVCTLNESREVTVQITAPMELAGAEISVDGRRWGVLGNPSAGMTIHGFPGGQHEIRISKEGYAPIRKTYKSEGKGYWLDERPIAVTVSPAELRKI